MHRVEIGSFVATYVYELRKMFIYSLLLDDRRLLLSPSVFLSVVRCCEVSLQQTVDNNECDTKPGVYDICRQVLVMPRVQSRTQLTPANMYLSTTGASRP